jgi:nucleotide-binding universal stress UspA family protein
MHMFKRVLWATDGSEAADRALPLAKTLASDGAGEMIIAHCEEHTMAGKGGPAYPRHPDEDDLRSKIDHQAAELSRDGVATKVLITRITVGGAAHAIADTAADAGADVIVVGTRGHTPLTGLLLGSVTQRLLHLTPCPVLVVPETEPSGSPRE